MKSGIFGVPGLVLPGHGTAWHKSGTSREILDGWQPYILFWKSEQLAVLMKAQAKNYYTSTTLTILLLTTEAVSCSNSYS